MAEITAKKGKSFTNSEFLKQRMLAVIEEVYPDGKKASEYNTSAQTCARHTEELGANLYEQLQIRAKSMDCFAFAMDESNNNNTDTVWSLIFMCGIMLPSLFMKNYEVYAV
jgi:hypothetical protein